MTDERPEVEEVDPRGTRRWSRPLAEVRSLRWEPTGNQCGGTPGSDIGADRGPAFQIVRLEIGLAEGERRKLLEERRPKEVRWVFYFMEKVLRERRRARRS